MTLSIQPPLPGFILCRSQLPLALLLACLALTACGGGGSATSVAPPPGTTTLSGVVEDGPIAGAKVYLVHKATEIDNLSCGDLGNERCEIPSTIAAACGPQGNEPCETLSLADGSFAFHAGSEFVAANYFVVASGGRDMVTGVDFTSLELRAPLDLAFASREAVVVSPITTLLAGLLDAGLDLDSAQSQLRQWLALPPGHDLGHRPSEDPELLRRSLLLTKVAMELRQFGTANPFRQLRNRVSQSAPLLLDADRLNHATLEQLGLDPAATSRIVSLAARLEQGLRAQWNHLFQQEELAQALTLAAKAMLVETADFNPENPVLIDNLRLLADQVLQAAGAAGIPFGGLAPQRIARYVLLSYNLRSYEALTRETSLFSESLALTDGTRLLQDPLIGQLAQTTTLHSVAAPLLEAERPGDDNQRRFDYYYKSDRSHLYQAEKLLATVLDDSVSDAVMLAILAGKAEAGMFEEAQTLLDTQIFGSENRGHGYRTYGKKLLEFGHRDAALAAMHQARALFNRVIAAKGNASAGTSDITNLWGLSSDFRKAEELVSAQAVLNDLELVARDLVTLNSYGRLIVGIWNVADSYLESGDLAAAAPVLNSLHRFALATPANVGTTVTTLRTRVFYLIETARRFAEMGDIERARAIAEEVEALRSFDGYSNLTGADTWPWIPALVTIRYQCGDEIEADRLAKSIPLTYLDSAGASKSGATQQLSAFKQVATYDALNGQLTKAFALVDSYFVQPEDKVDVLTYFAANKGVPYIGLGLIQKGDFFNATSALQRAEQALNRVVATTDPNRYTLLIQRGWVKLADLYALMGDTVTARALLLRSETILPAITAALPQVNALRDIALGYHQRGFPAEAIRLLTAAEARTAASAALLPEEITSLHDSIIQAWLKIGARDRAQQAVVAALQATRNIYNPNLVYTGTAHDDQAGKEVDALLKLAQHLVDSGAPELALPLLDEAQTTADRIFVAATRLGKYIHSSKAHLIGGYGNAEAFDQALSLAQNLPFTSNRNQAIQYLANLYATRDDFPGHWVASVDSDRDGKPDFFNPLASAADIAASGLLLDDDSDGDGIVDRLDWRPLFRDR
ncbi:MAG: hypothetical protein ACYDAI_11280 [Trichloromonadaceae bacterium]